jgi:hypothetical protein
MWVQAQLDVSKRVAPSVHVQGGKMWGKIIWRHAKVVTASPMSSSWPASMNVIQQEHARDQARSSLPWVWVRSLLARRFAQYLLTRKNIPLGSHAKSHPGARVAAFVLGHGPRWAHGARRRTNRSKDDVYLCLRMTMATWSVPSLPGKGVCVCQGAGMLFSLCPLL